MTFSTPAAASYGLARQAPQIGYASQEPQGPTVVPPVLYLPVRELPGGGLLAEVCATTDGKHALLVFTALDRLLEACGSNQAWKLVEMPALDAIQETQPFDLVAFDPELPHQLLADGRIA